MVCDVPCPRAAKEKHKIEATIPINLGMNPPNPFSFNFRKMTPDRIDKRWNRRFPWRDCRLQTQQLRSFPCDGADHGNSRAGGNGKFVRKRGWAGENDTVDFLRCEDFGDITPKSFDSAVHRYDVDRRAAAAQLIRQQLSGHFGARKKNSGRDHFLGKNLKQTFCSELLWNK